MAWDTTKVLNDVAEPADWNDMVDAVKGKGLSVLSYGAEGDGIADDSGEFDDAIVAAANDLLIIPEGTYKLSNSVTVPVGVSILFQQGAKLSIDSGKTFTVNGELIAGLTEIFSGSGDVVLVRGSCEHVLPQWWGAKGDDSTDCHDAIETAITVAWGSGIGVGKVYLASGIYQTTASIDDFPTGLPGTHNTGILIQGASMGQSIIKYTGNSGYAIRLWNTTKLTANDSKTVTYVTLRDLHIDAADADGGISFDGCESCLLDRVAIHDIDHVAGKAIHGCRGSHIITEDSYTHDTWKDFATAGKYAISFTPQSTVSGPLKDVTVTMKKIDSGALAGTITAALYTDSAGPDTLVGYASQMVNCTSLSAAAGGATVTFSWDWDKDIDVSASAKQWIVFETSGYTYNDGVDEIAIYVDAGAGAANEFGTYSGSWSLSTDGANNVIDILKWNSQFNKLDGVQVRTVSATAMKYGLNMEHDSQFYITQCSIHAKRPVYAVGEPYIQAVASNFENDDEDRPVYIEVTPVDNPGGGTWWTNCWFEDGETNPLKFDGGFKHVFTNCAIGGRIEWTNGTQILIYGSQGQQFVSTGGGQIVPDLLRRTYVAGSQFLKVDGGTTVDADALNGVRIDLVAEASVNLRFGIPRDHQATRLPRGVWAVTVYAKIDDAAGDVDFQMYIFTTSTVMKSHLPYYALTTTYEPYTGIMVVDSTVVGDDQTITINFKNKATAKNVYISHVVLEYLGADDSRRDVILTNPAAEDTDGGRESKVIWIGRQTGDEQGYMATITGSHDGAADDQKGQLEFLVNSGAEGEAPSKGFKVISDGGVLMSDLKSGANQGAAGAAVDELWIDTADQTIKVGV